LIAAGALAAAAAVTALVLALRRRSPVGTRLARISPDERRASSRLHALVARDARDLVQSGLGWSELDLMRAKVVGALAMALLASAVTIVTPVGPIVVAAAAYAGFVAPSLRIARLAASRRDAADRALVGLVEWTEALVASGRPVESALAAVAERGLGAPVMDAALAAAARSYALGAPLFASLAREAAGAGLTALGALADELERARDLGRGALAVLRDERDRLRAAERARGLDAAGRVEGRLMLVLVLCYLPALMLLVVIPLFLGLLDGLFG